MAAISLAVVIVRCRGTRQHTCRPTQNRPTAARALENLDAEAQAVGRLPPHSSVRYWSGRPELVDQLLMGRRNLVRQTRFWRGAQ
jgi:hypothetical protein